MGAFCPQCGASGKVIDSRTHGNIAVVRRRKCGNGHRWTTREVDDARWAELLTTVRALNDQVRIIKPMEITK